MSINRLSRLAAFCGLLAAPQAASAAVVQWTIASGGNGHYYELITTLVNWTAARDAAAAKTYQNTPGHLATITSAEENQFVWNNVSGTYFWIGAYKDNNSWHWVTGESWGYVNWDAGQPDNSGGNENAIEIWRNPQWNDLNQATIRKYLIEYDAVPEPSAWRVLFAAAVAFALFRRRQQPRHA